MKQKNKFESKSRRNLQVTRHDGKKVEFEEVESFLFRRNGNRNEDS